MMHISDLLKVGGGSAEYIFDIINIILVIGAFLDGGGLAEYIFNIILVIDALLGGGDGTNNFNIEK